jgi:hypothetical protein
MDHEIAHPASYFQKTEVKAENFLLIFSATCVIDLAHFSPHYFASLRLCTSAFHPKACTNVAALAQFFQSSRKKS